MLECYCVALNYNTIDFLIGGYNDGDTDIILSFDTKNLEWTQIGKMGHKMRLHGLGVVPFKDIIDYCKYVAAPDYELFHTLL